MVEIIFGEYKNLIRCEIVTICGIRIDVHDAMFENNNKRQQKEGRRTTLQTDATSDNEKKHTPQHIGFYLQPRTSGCRSFSFNNRVSLIERVKYS